MTSLRRLLYLAALALRLACVAGPVVAGPQIEVEFDVESGSGDVLVHARALYPVAGTHVRYVFDAITEYPSLHDWIEGTQLVSSDVRSQEYLVEFRFPWPVGRQWSRVRVWRQGQDCIRWHQIEGSLQANRGEIVLGVSDAKAQIDYRAVMDVGLPDVLTRPYKKRFVAEFLGAVYERATAPRLQLATTARR
jgi:hypothetical protein